MPTPHRSARLVLVSLLAAGCADAPAGLAADGLPADGLPAERPTLAKSAKAGARRVSAAGSIAINGAFPGAEPEQYNFHASVDKNGEVQGEYRADWSIPDVDVRMDIVCLSAVADGKGGVAQLGGRVTESSDPAAVAVGSGWVWRVEDNGEGSKAPPDVISETIPSATPEQCAAPIVPQYRFAWTHGNIQVK